MVILFPVYSMLTDQHKLKIEKLSLFILQRCQINYNYKQIYTGLKKKTKAVFIYFTAFCEENKLNQDKHKMTPKAVFIYLQHFEKLT